MKVNPRKKSAEFAIERYVKICESLGYKIDEAEENSIYFYGPQGFIFFLSREESGAHFVGVSLRIGVGETPLEKQSEVERYVNSEYKILKCYYDDGAIVFACEGFDTGINECRSFIEYAVSATDYAFKDVSEKFPDVV